MSRRLVTQQVSMREREREHDVLLPLSLVYMLSLLLRSLTLSAAARNKYHKWNREHAGREKALAVMLMKKNAVRRAE